MTRFGKIFFPQITHLPAGRQGFSLKKLYLRLSAQSAGTLFACLPVGRVLAPPF
ncbi:MAG: hypothetical protein HYY40_11065 [Bacteroidetes bacterium]|nr:hypothetical protein [Bacteroidota bacterium]